ncbi:MAG: OsmC family protein [Flavobacteriales bacterium]|nr:OsmC family protein [Flavobacteriales bacterium]
MNNKVTIKKCSGSLSFTAKDHAQNVIDIGSDLAKGMSPVDLLLSALASCSAYDVAAILEKGGKLLELEVQVEGVRKQEEQRKPFETIHLRFIVKGPFEKVRVKRVVDLAVEKYCSVGATIRPETKITHELVFSSVFSETEAL